MPQGRLAQVLRELGPGRDDERLLVGPETLDDAGIVVLGQGSGLSVALVQTVDFFPPVVDDPELYGAIAAANALSDVYAMGGRPLSALCLASFPGEFPEEWIGAILRGGFAKVREAGAVLAGGHTVEGEVQFGFAVTGTVQPERVTANTRAEAGDAIWLTKPLGMGVMTTAAKKGRISWEELLPAARSMATLNRAAALAMEAAGARACTDVTGYGLLGHGRNLAAASGLTLRLEAAALPIFPGAEPLARQGLFSGGAARGRAALGAEVRIEAGVEDWLASLCFDAETSGGLLVAVDPAAEARFERELAQRGARGWRVGQLLPREEAVVVLAR